MGTYIIHFDDKPWEDLDNEQYYRCKEIPWFSTTKTTISRLTPYTEPDLEQIKADWYKVGREAERVRQPNLEQVRKEAYDTAYADAEEIYESGKRAMYQKGLKDAWEAARKICTNWVLPDSVLSKIFGKDKTIDDIMIENTASEAIATIRAYEQEKEIQVGDEVEAMAGNAVVIEVIDGGQTVRYMYPDTITGRNKACNVTRTGRHFPEIAEVLRKMDGEE